MYWTRHLSGGPTLVYHDAVAIKTNIFVFGNSYSQNENACATSLKQMHIHVLDTVKMKWLYLNLNKEQDLKCVPSNTNGHRVVAHNSKIYLWGGHGFEAINNTLYCFDTITCEWSKPNVYGDIPPPIIGHALCIIKNCLYIHGGLQQDCEYVKHLYMINLDTMNWNIIKTMGNMPRTFSHTATAINNKIYVFGGAFNKWSVSRPNDNGLKYSKLYCLNTTTRRWKRPTVSQFKPLARHFHSAFSHNGFLYIFGGTYENMTFQFQNIHRYDPKTSTWIEILPKGISPCSKSRMICAVVNDRVFISGGIINRPTILLNQPSITYYTRPKFEDDVHVLDLNPSLYDICLVNLWNHVEKNEINIKDLCIPLLLKKDLAAVGCQEKKTDSE